MPPAALSPPSLPSWVVKAASIAIAVHLFLVVAALADATSGPWATPLGGSIATPPQFANLVGEHLGQPYQRLTRVANTFRFASSRPLATDAIFEAHLKDADGTVIARLPFPEEGVNRWVKHRQRLLARALAEDVPVERPESVVLPAPGQDPPRAPIWDMTGPQQLAFRQVPQHLVPRDRPTFRPSDWSVLLAASYGRYLQRTHPGTASVALVRRSREPIFPMVLFQPGPPPAAAFEDLVADYGDVTALPPSREKRP